MAKLHELKCWPEYFQPVIDNLKKLELRKNDRGYQVGDVLWLREFILGFDKPFVPGEPTPGTYTGRQTFRLVTHMISGESWGLRENTVAMSIRMISPRQLSNMKLLPTPLPSPG